MSEREKHKLQLKVVEKKVPFREGEDNVMYCLKPKAAHPLPFGDKVMKTFLRNCSFQISGQRKFVEEWERKKKRK